MPLSARQLRLYTHRIDLYKPSTVFETSGVASGASWELAASDVPCYFEIQSNLDDPTAIGRVKSDMFITLDTLHLAEDQECGADWMVHNKTLDSETGLPSRNYGLWWRVRGPARDISQGGTRHAQKREFKVYLEDTPPEGIS